MSKLKVIMFLLVGSVAMAQTGPTQVQTIDEGQATAQMKTEHFRQILSRYSCQYEDQQLDPSSIDDPKLFYKEFPAFHFRTPWEDHQILLSLRCFKNDIPEGRSDHMEKNCVFNDPSLQIMVRFDVLEKNWRGKWTNSADGGSSLFLNSLDKLEYFEGADLPNVKSKVRFRFSCKARK